MSEPRLPNFFVAGAPKAGTTSLYHALRQHPQIFMSPVKEPSYFSREARPENLSPALRKNLLRKMDVLQEKLRQGTLDANQFSGVITCWDDYLSLFRMAGNEIAVGEGSVCYLWSATAAREIAAMDRAAKILLILRNPADRAFSQYLHYLSDGNKPHSFRVHIEASLKPSNCMDECHPFLEMGLYAQQLERYFQVFPREQIRIWLYEETLHTPDRFLHEVFSFLGVDPTFKPDRGKRYHQMEIPRAIHVMQGFRRAGLWRACRAAVPVAARRTVKRLVYKPYGTTRMPDEDRRFLVEYYREDLLQLQRMLNRDLSSWLQ